MNQPVKAQEPSMEEILASIRRIIADDDAAKAPAKATDPAPRPQQKPPEPVPAPVELAARAASEPVAMTQDDIDAMLSNFDEPEPAPQPRKTPAQDILELTEAMAASSQATAFETIDGENDVVFTEPEEAPESPTPPPPPPPPPAAATRPMAPPIADTLLSNQATAAVDAAFSSLAHTVLVQNSRTLEDLVKEMLRPMLKSWLDDNLPSLVERLVRAEIERVSRGR